MVDLQRTSILKRARERLLAGRIGEASACCRKLLKRRKDDTDALSILVLVALERNAPEEAESLALRCVGLRPRSADYQILLGLTLARQRRYDEALDQYDKALRLDPSNLRAIANRAIVHEQRGDPARGLEELTAVVERGEDDADIAYQCARLQTQLEQYDHAIELARRTLSRRPMPPGQRRLLLFTLGKALEKTGHADEAFRAYAEANGLQPIDHFDVADVVRWDEKLMEVMSGDVLARLPQASAPSETPIFIVGMPRSGTTLTEFILDAHPLVRGIGEARQMTDLVPKLNLKIGSTLPFPECVTDLEQSDVDELSSAYLAELRRRYAPDDPGVRWFADKTMDSHRYLGVISLLFPNAKLVWVRREALDNCLGCFGEPLDPSTHPYAADLRSIGVMYRLHERVMEHWQEALDIPILELHYEQLVQEPEAMTRRLVEFCDLPWDDACLRHHESDRHARTLSSDQVRQPIYTTSVSRAARFEKHLGPLREALDAAGSRSAGSMGGTAPVNEG